jgi:hypothetical protein
MALKLRPSRRGNFNKTGDRLAELGIPFTGYDHHQNCYIGVEVPPELEAVVSADPLIEVVTDEGPKLRRSGPVWASSAEFDPEALGGRLRALRLKAGLELAGAAALTAGALSADAIDVIERTGACTLADLVTLSDAYGGSLDKLVGRLVIRGNRRR